MNRRSHFSYVEVIIVAIVLGMAGREITPQFTEASNEERKVCELVEGLETMRAQLDLYWVQHGNRAPPADTFAVFEMIMTKKIGLYGPYIKEIPTNPFNGLKTVRFDGEPAGAGKAGWRLDTEKGLFQADNNAACAAL
jgi:type II secretory pathway pseudopilin PulG